MALEALEGNKFSYWSDIWSVGVTMWEIFSYGETPYPGYTWNTDFVDILRAGLRLTKPAACPEELYVNQTSIYPYILREKILFSSDTSITSKIL